MHAKNFKYPKIKRLLVERENFKISINSISAVVKKYRISKRITDFGHTGRYPILKPFQLDYLDDLIRYDRFITCGQIIKNLKDTFGTKIGVTTIRDSAVKIKWIKKSTR